MHPYRTHTCGELSAEQAGTTVRLSGWAHHKRDHGGALFVDLRDHYGLTQVVFTPGSAGYEEAGRLSRESVVTVTGEVALRPADAVNEELPTGQIEVHAGEQVLLSAAEALPFAVAEEQPVAEALRLQHRFLDLRREGLHRRIALRSQVISSPCGKPGRNLLSGSVNWSFPWSWRTRTAAAVNCLATEPIMKRVCGVFGTWCSWLARP